MPVSDGQNNDNASRVAAQLSKVPKIAWIILFVAIGSAAWHGLKPILRSRIIANPHSAPCSFVGIWRAEPSELDKHALRLGRATADNNQTSAYYLAIVPKDRGVNDYIVFGANQAELSRDPLLGSASFGEQDRPRAWAYKRFKYDAVRSGENEISAVVSDERSSFGSLRCNFDGGLTDGVRVYSKVDGGMSGERAREVFGTSLADHVNLLREHRPDR